MAVTAECLSDGKAEVSFVCDFHRLPLVLDKFEGDNKARRKGTRTALTYFAVGRTSFHKFHFPWQK